MPLRLGFAGTFTDVTFSSPGRTNSPAPFFPKDPSAVASRALSTFRTSLGAAPDTADRWATRAVLLSTVATGLGAAGFAGADFADCALPTAFFTALAGVFFDAMG